MSINYTELMDYAIKASEKSYSPYSKFSVGAAVLMNSGKIYMGCNVENASYGMTICAERNAIFKAVSEGERGIVAIAIYSPQKGDCYPCGACRQVISEFQFGDNEIEIVTENNGKLDIKKLADYMPYMFKF